MNCMKCGRETQSGKAFCPDCLAIMAEYPVKPGTPIHIPKRKEYEENKQSRRKKEISPEEYVERLRVQLRWLSVVAVALLAAVVLLGLLLFRDYLLPQEEQDAPVSRNYTVTQDDGSMER